MAILKIKKDTFPRLILVITISLILLYMGILGGLVIKLYDLQSMPASLIEQYAKSLDLTRSELNGLGQTTSKLEAILDNFQKSLKYPKNEAIALELAKIITDIEFVKRDFSSIKEIILQNPEKALSVTLLNKDFNNYRDLTSKYLIALEGRIHDNFTLIIGVSAGFVLILFGLLITTLFEKKKEPKSSSA
jgi:hypothetical protein